jgi:hypothetical protein
MVLGHIVTVSRSVSDWVWKNLWLYTTVVLLTMDAVTSETCWANKLFKHIQYWTFSWIRIKHKLHYVYLFTMEQLPLVGQGLLFIKDSRSRSDTQQSVGLLWTSEQPIAETSIWQHNTHSRQTSIVLAGFDPTVPANERPKTHALDRTAIGIGSLSFVLLKLKRSPFLSCALRCFKVTLITFVTKRRIELLSPCIVGGRWMS